jgi:hypothetical protein
MFATLVTVTLFAAAAINGAAAQLSIETPTMTTCQPVEITWGATTGPYNLIMVSPDDPCGDAIVDLGDIDGTSVSYTPALAPGTQVELSLVDSLDNEAWSGSITIGQGSDTSCVPADLLASASSSAAATSSSAVVASSSDVAASSVVSSSIAVTGTTLVVTSSVASAAQSASSSASSPAASVVGAVGESGPLGGSSNGAMTHVAAPFMLLSAITAVLAFSL